MAISFVQQSQITSASAGTIAKAFTSNTTTGNFLLAVVEMSGSGSMTLSSVSDGTNSFKRLASITNTGSVNVDLWYANNIVGAVTPTVTATLNTASRSTLNIIEVSGVDTVQPIDVVSSRFIQGASTTSFPGTTPQLKATNEFVFVYCATDAITGTWTADASLGNVQTQAGAVTGNTMNGSRVVSSQAALSFLSTKSSNAIGVIFIITLADITLPSNYLGTALNNFQFFKVGDGMSTGEKIR